MRDPLSWVPVKYKLPLSFLFICLAAFGVGGVVVTSTAGEALEGQIRLRLDEHAAATTLVMERELALLGRRVEDFASDGFIRTEFAALCAGDREARTRLERHLAANKLPLVDCFIDAAAVGEGGAPVVRVDEGWDPAAEGSAATWFGPLREPSDAHPYPTFLIVTPLRSLDGTHRLGTLQLLVRADTWVAGLSDLGMLPQAGLVQVALVDTGGHRLPLGSGPVPAAGGDVLAYTTSVRPNGWQLYLAADRSRVMEPIATLRERYLVIGGLLLVVTAAVLFFPVRFLLKPLASIREAALRITEGDFRVRVAYDSKDEIGDLSHAFNIMAGAVEERTRRLEEAAHVLERRETEIRVQRDRLEAVIRSMQDGLFILDREGLVTLSNAAAQPLVRALEAADPQRIDCRRGDEAVRCLRCLTERSRPHRPCMLEVGNRVYEVHATTLLAPDGPVAGHLCVSRDVTERIAAADRQAHQERMAVLGEVAAVMAHELNNPLAAIAMFSQMLGTQVAEGTREKESAEVIRRNAETCRQTIRRLLDMAAHPSTEMTEFDVAELLEDVGAFLRPLYERAQVTCTVESGAAHGTILGDMLQLRQVLINLVMNAIQAFEGRPGHVVVSSRDQGEEVEILVRDDGPGIPEEARAHIFQPFFTTKPAGTGTGLGLPTSRRIAEAHGGALELQETGAGGTTFRLVLPRRGTRASSQARARMAHGVLASRFPVREAGDG